MPDADQTLKDRRFVTSLWSSATARIIGQLKNSSTTPGRSALLGPAFARRKPTSPEHRSIAHSRHLGSFDDQGGPCRIGQRHEIHLGGLRGLP